MNTSVSVGDVVASVEGRYPVRLAESWDSVGLVCGHLDATVSTVVLTVDVTDDVIAWAQSQGASMIIAHHPMIFSGMTRVPASTSRGRMLHALIESGIALLTAHTNGDCASDGVSDALANLLGLQGLSPIVANVGDPATGIGRRGHLAEAVTLTQFADRVSSVVPATAVGIKVSGDPEQLVRTVAVCGGAGDSLLDDVRDVDVYVTSDLRHHRALDHRAEGGGALIDIPHWAGEWPWLCVLAQGISRDLASIDVKIYTEPTDPWTWRRP